MTILAVPNVSIGSDSQVILELSDAIRSSGAVVLDTHTDPVHDRSVFTVADPSGAPIEAMVALAQTSLRLDLTAQRGVHPRTGVLDVCPFVPHKQTMTSAVEAARTTGSLIAELVGLPVYLYGEAATRSPKLTLPDIRRGGLAELKRRAADGFAPDFGGLDINDRSGVVCVGARSTLIAFNVWVRCELEVARTIASRVRQSSGGLPGVRSLGLLIDPPKTCQVSLNLTAPEATGIETAFGAVADHAQSLGATIIATELVGLVPRRFLPAPGAQAARLLMEPGRSLEAVLAAARI